MYWGKLRQTSKAQSTLNLYLRLLWVIFTARRRSVIGEDNLYNEIHTIVLPNDLDLNLHVNNGRYLTLCDFNRVDLFVRAGLAAIMLRDKLVPVVAEHSMTYIKPLYVFNRIKVAMKITHWDEKYFYATHTFYRGSQTVAEGSSKSLVVSKKDGRLTPDAVVSLVNAWQAERI